MGRQARLPRAAAPAAAANALPRARGLPQCGRQEEVAAVSTIVVDVFGRPAFAIKVAGGIAKKAGDDEPKSVFKITPNK